MSGRAGPVGAGAHRRGARRRTGARGAALPAALVPALAVAVLAALCVWLVWRGSERRAQTVAALRQQLAAAAAANEQLDAENRRLRAQLDEVAAGPEHDYAAAEQLAREGRLGEARVAFDELAAQYPVHSLAPRARAESERLARRLAESHLSELGLTLSDVRSGWTRVGPAGAPAAAAEGIELLAPFVSLRLRNTTGEPLADLYVRADFVTAGEHEPRVLGDGFVPVSSVLGPGVAIDVTLTSLGALDGPAGDAAAVPPLPPVVARVYVKRPGVAFRDVGAFEVEPRLIDP